MTPCEFSGQTLVLAKNQPEYLPLPVRWSADHTVTSCWCLTWWERLKLLVTGRLWLQQLTFGGRLQPQHPTVDNPL